MKYFLALVVFFTGVSVGLISLLDPYDIDSDLRLIGGIAGIVLASYGIDFIGRLIPSQDTNETQTQEA